ncbi:CobW family GTP-binding protein [Paenibacillus cymbidii]|uniref:CobW family GTP-binding protein n=1 Tax=Paenibacillus cymbidii TaxID=1639034 RepID=UPI0010822CE1|nr:GTP-binding protein [Paenibacillus cymbidii]
MHTIPVIILSGFLGSGKTTLLLRLLAEAEERGLRPAVLMNELGKLDMDGHMLRQRSPGLTLEKLLDGCICCDKKEEVAASLLLLAARQPDVVLIELTGVANPEEVADCLTEPALRGTLTLQRIVTVLDAEHVREYNSIFASDRELVHTLRRQMEVADRILVNKCDLVPAAEQAKIEKTIRKQNSAAPIRFTTQSRYEEPFLHDIPAYSRQHQSALPAFRVLSGSGASHRRHHSHLPESNQPAAEVQTRSFSRLQTITLPQSGKLDRGQLERFLKQRPTSLLRAKGYVSLRDQPGVWLVQWAGKRLYWEPSNYEGDTYLVLIGTGLDAGALRSEWTQLAGRP